jgi:hypothetical protein
MEKHTMIHARNSTLALGLAAILAVSAALPSFAAAPMSNAAALQAAAPDNVMQVHERSRRNRRPVADAYGYQSPPANVYGSPYHAPRYPYAGAYPSYGGSANGYDCLGGRDSDGVPCGGGY